MSKICYIIPLVLALAGSTVVTAVAVVGPQPQLAHGVAIGPSGTINVPGMLGTTIRAPPGSNVSNLTVTRYGPNGSVIESNPINANSSSTGTEVNPSKTIIEPFLNLTNGTWTLYNETSGSTSLMKFNHDGTYDRILHGNPWHGIWDASIITEKVLQMCPTGQGQGQGQGGNCDLISLEPDTPNSLGFLDSLGHTMHLIHNGYSVPPPQISTMNRTTITSVRAALSPFMNLANGTWTLYNESDGTTSLLQFIPNGIYNKVDRDKDENGNSNSTGIWNTSVVTKEVFQMCPTEA